MSSSIEEIIIKATGCHKAEKIETIQTLWSGYGSIDRYRINGGNIKSVVIKHVKLPERVNHPRGWNTDLSHNRKVKSYEVETAWYRLYNGKTSNSCKTANCLALESIGDETVIVMEDLDATGFNIRKSSVKLPDIHLVLSWLANFHALFMMQSPKDLWEIGTYWHLKTRPEELEALKEGELKEFAHRVDETLNSCKYQTLVHGDAKLANFCFSEDGVAAVDFQYIGGGCGMKDVAYFIGSCLYEEDCERYEEELLGFYFKSLTSTLKSRPEIESNEVVKEWKKMYRVGWADFHRFLKGWSPDHWKINSYSERVSREVISDLKVGKV